MVLLLTNSLINPKKIWSDQLITALILTKVEAVTELPRLPSCPIGKTNTAGATGQSARPWDVQLVPLSHCDGLSQFRVYVYSNTSHLLVGGWSLLFHTRTSQWIFYTTCLLLASDQRTKAKLKAGVGTINHV